MTELKTPKKRGRPANTSPEIREKLIRSGLEHLTEHGFFASGIDAILKNVGVPKGSFYHYFKNKEAFGLAVMESYASYFAYKLDKILLDESEPPLQRLRNYAEQAKQAMQSFNFKRGCLVGNLGQEVDLLPESYRQILMDIFTSWEQRVAQCLQAAQAAGEISTTTDCQQLAEYFWIGWEGAVSRAKLQQSNRALDLYIDHFIAALPR